MGGYGADTSQPWRALIGDDYVRGSRGGYYWAQLYWGCVRRGAAAMPYASRQQAEGDEEKIPYVHRADYTSIQSNSRCQMLHRVSRDATVGERVELWEGWHPWFRRSMASS